MSYIYYGTLRPAQLSHLYLVWQAAFHPGGAEWTDLFSGQHYLVQCTWLVTKEAYGVTFLWSTHGLSGQLTL